MRVVNTFDAVFHQFADFLRRYRAAAAAEYLDMRCTEFGQAVDHVTEEFLMAALIGTNSNAVCIFLDRRSHDVVDATVMPKMNNFRPLRLDQATHNVDGRVMAVE